MDSPDLSCVEGLRPISPVAGLEDRAGGCGMGNTGEEKGIGQVYIPKWKRRCDGTILSAQSQGGWAGMWLPHLLQQRNQ